LTTHAMDEADALCSRIGVIVHGELCAIGSSERLKAKFGSGFRLEVKLQGAGAEKRLNELLKGEFEGGVVTSMEGGRAVCRVEGLKGRRLGEVFALLEERKSEAWMREYFFAQPTLEQVFEAIVTKAGGN